jgi:hypothetical protein
MGAAAAGGWKAHFRIEGHIDRVLEVIDRPSRPLDRGRVR